MASAKKGAGKEINNGLYAKILEVKKQEKAQEAMKEALSKPEVQKELAKIFGEPVIGSVTQKTKKINEIETNAKQLVLVEKNNNGIDTTILIPGNSSYAQTITKELLGEDIEFVSKSKEQKDIIENPWSYERNFLDKKSNTNSKYPHWEAFFNSNSVILETSNKKTLEGKELKTLYTWTYLDKIIEKLRTDIENDPNIYEIKYITIDGYDDKTGMFIVNNSDFVKWHGSLYGNKGINLGELADGDGRIPAGLVVGEANVINIANKEKKEALVKLLPALENKLASSNNFSIHPDEIEKTTYNTINLIKPTTKNTEGASKVLAKTTTTASLKSHSRFSPSP
jgi:hypothetical protein